MHNNWYTNNNDNKKRRTSIKLHKGSFSWENTIFMDNSYNVVVVKIADAKYNFYLWSKKTVKTAKSLYEEGSFDKSIKMLKKYSFDLNIIEDE